MQYSREYAIILASSCCSLSSFRTFFHLQYPIKNLCHQSLHRWSNHVPIMICCLGDAVQLLGATSILSYFDILGKAATFSCMFSLAVCCVATRILFYIALWLLTSSAILFHIVVSGISHSTALILQSLLMKWMTEDYALKG